MGIIILAEEFRSSPALDMVQGIDSLPCPPAKFHTDGKEALYIIVPLSELSTSVAGQDGSSTSSVQLLQTFAIDRDRITAWQDAGYIRGVRSEDEHSPGTADIFVSRAQAQTAVNARNEQILRAHYNEVYQARRSGSEVQCGIQDVSYKYDDLAVTKPAEPTVRPSPFGFNRA